MKKGDLSANGSKSPLGWVKRAVRRGDERTLTIVDGTRSKGVRIWGPPVGASFRSVKRTNHLLINQLRYCMSIVVFKRNYTNGFYY